MATTTTSAPADESFVARHLNSVRGLLILQVGEALGDHGRVGEVGIRALTQKRTHRAGQSSA
jgi:hypothetical protein